MLTISRPCGVGTRSTQSSLNPTKRFTRSDTQERLRSSKEQAPLTTLQRAMGHADLKTTLGYLRNLEVPMLKVEDMPMFGA